MERIETTVFLSYRRTNIPWALAIYQNLAGRGFDVFFDFTSTPSGDFERVILDNIIARAHFLVLLTPSALERCDDPADFVRREIETALVAERNIVPLLLEGFDFSSPAIAKHLTGMLARLKSYNAVRVPADYFDEAMERLCVKYLNVPLAAVLHPIVRSTQRIVLEQQTAANAAPRVLQRHLTAQEWFEKGYQLDDNSDEEISWYTEAIRLKPDYAEALNNRGIVRRARGDLAGSIEDFSTAIRFKPDYADAYFNRGNAHSSQGNLAHAIEDFGAVIRLKPKDADAYLLRGRARKTQGDLPGAIQDFGAAIGIKPDYASAYLNRCKARYDQGDLAGAMEDCNEAIRLDRNDATAYNNRGRIRKTQGDIAGAIKDYNEAIRLNPRFAEAYNNRGSAHKTGGDLSGALKDYDEAIRLRPDFASAYHNRALVRERMGSYAAASDDYQMYLDLGGATRDSDRSKVKDLIRSLMKRH